MQIKAALVSALLLLLTLCPVSGCPVHVTEEQFATLTETVKQIQQDNADLTQDVIDLKQNSTALQQQVTQLQEMIMNYLDGESTEAPPTLGPPFNTSSGGATYVRWGRTSCPEETDLVYKGYAGGGKASEEGSAVDYLCLPEDPQYASNAAVELASNIYGGEYQTHSSIFNNLDQDVPCAVCRSPTRSSAIMVPARTSCYPGFHLEYYGYLMAGYYLHKAASEHVCVDSSPEIIAGGERDENPKLFYFSVSRCVALKCPPFEEGRAMTCAVCSK